jgi:hypothetical protein
MDKLKKWNIEKKLIKFINEDLEKKWLQELIEDIKKSLIIILWETNDLLYIENWIIYINLKCVTWMNWFSNVPWTKTTPVWWHIICEKHWDWLDENTIFKWRKDTWRKVEYYPDEPIVFPVITTRILVLDWIEKNENITTKQRYIYIHWNPNLWYWNSDNYKRTFWCIWLKPSNIIKLFNLVKKQEKTFVYIKE